MSEFTEALFNSKAALNAQVTTEASLALGFGLDPSLDLLASLCAVACNSKAIGVR